MQVIMESSLAGVPMVSALIAMAAKPGTACSSTCFVIAWQTVPAENIQSAPEEPRRQAPTS